jgi:electron transfer flavoprotein alpha subunit
MKEIGLEGLKKKGVWVFGIIEEGELSSSSVEVLTAGRDVADALETGLVLVCLTGEEVKEETFSGLLADQVYLVRHKALESFKDDLFSKVLTSLVKAGEPVAFFFPASAEGCAIAPRLAGALRLGLCAHVNRVEVKEGKILLYRPTFGDNIIAVLSSKTQPVLATLSEGAFGIKRREGSPELFKVKMPEDFSWESALEVRKLEERPKEASPLVNAKVVVAGGRGIKSKEKFEKLFLLAKALGGEVGATRPVCYEGWISEDRMIGVSGVTVRPKLYIGFGISGALQHTVGMENSEFIVAVNTDKEAPLVKMADLALIGDASEVLDHLLKLLDQEKK